ncbi:hypothetical protein Q4F19_04750 [Sphingomonas sp. BIUV-7]|uniref:Uncharacterized protein n=1 Tax=Sphingomonas natans TaxID=3063330 RepID=A0ABT8Y7L1_9SPHN|nr:hypothetical protein [Sphingomonas sp. BIUV-7]MDO6413685.1 hypothetical protein [Sphingomonas sp. BIUV-7]
MSVETSAPMGELALDPFAYVPGMASRINGLGGEGAPDGDYAFHTPYVVVAEGIAHFKVHFGSLKATTGTLNLRVHMLSAGEQHARLATAERIALNRLVAVNGFHQLRFEAFHGVIYALYGGIIGDTDAEASDLQVVLDRPADPNEMREVVAEARNTAFGGESLATPELVSLAPATLKTPVTQLATDLQLRGLDARQWFGGAHDRTTALTRWKSSYVVQAVRAYGFLRPGARGAGLDCEEEAIFEKLTAEGCDVDAIIPPEREALGGSGVSTRVAALDPLSPEVVNYDFLWTDGLCSRLGSAAAGVRFIEAAMAALRPGGLAVHVIDYDPSGETVGPFARGDIERICIILISRGHDVAEFRIDDRKLIVGPNGLSACGIVCRKAALIT